MRINEPFGDVVNWDLLPQSAIASLQVLPGSNPLFGLNTLGGALVDRRPRAAAAIRAAPSSSRADRSAAARSSTSRAAPRARGTGSSPPTWRASAAGPSTTRAASTSSSASSASQNERLAVDVTLTAADNRLEGTQTLPPRGSRRRARPTPIPDRNHNQVAMLGGQGQPYAIAPDVRLGGNAYLRRYRNRNTSSNVNDDFGQLDPATGAADTVQASNDRSTHRSDELRRRPAARRRPHRSASIATSWSSAPAPTSARARFVQDSQPADVHAVASDRRRPADFERQTDAGDANRTLALFAQDIFSLTPAWTLSLSARADTARVEHPRPQRQRARRSTAIIGSRASIRRSASPTTRRRARRSTAATTKACARRRRSS